MTAITSDHLAALARFDTPTICYALELVAPDTRLTGYTAQTMIAAPDHLSLPGGVRAICWRAKTARIAARSPHNRSGAENNALKAAYYEYVADCDLPVILVVEDTDADPIGAFWGEVHSALHRALGAAGAVTNGVVRDLDDLDPRFLILAGKVAPRHRDAHRRYSAVDPRDPRGAGAAGNPWSRGREYDHCAGYPCNGSISRAPCGPPSCQSATRNTCRQGG